MHLTVPPLPSLSTQDSSCLCLCLCLLKLLKRTGQIFSRRSHNLGLIFLSDCSSQGGGGDMAGSLETRVRCEKHELQLAY